LSSSSTLEEPDITVAALPAADLAGLYIAQDYGFFAQQGLPAVRHRGSAGNPGQIDDRSRLSWPAPASYAGPRTG